MKTTIKSALLASAVLSVFAATATAAPATPGHAAGDTTVVLVHGAFADGSSWDKVIPLLQAKGVKVVSVQNPLSSLADDVVAAQRVIDAQTGKVVLVGHSWGGAVITQAGTSDKVKALVYVGSSGKNYPTPAGVPTLQEGPAGFVSLPVASYAANFAQDLPAATTRVLAATQGLFPAKNFAEPVTVAAWKNKPNYYIVAGKDRMIDPGLQRDFARKINAVTSTVQTSHVPMVSQPEHVADVILAAVKR
jgi:pimeloyl-ACP methyl ester carboxylesterase